MITAIVLCRSNSSRLKNKHFYKIGGKPLIEIIIDKLSKINLISEIYIATGSKKKNLKYLSLKKNKKDLKFFFHRNEKNVSERIFFLSKKIKNSYCLIVSGDCPIIDNNFVKLLYKKLSSDLIYDLVKFSKKIYYEGINLIKTNSWKKIYQISKTKDFFTEHFSKIFDSKDKNLKIKLIEPPKSYLKPKFSKMRLSIDTISDLNFFETLFSKVNSFNKLNLHSIKKHSYLTKINEHVLQRKVGKTYDKKFLLITAANKTIGYGHLKRCLVLKRQIEETVSTNIHFKYINKSHLNNNLRKKYNFKKFVEEKNSTIIVDLPKYCIKEFQFKLKKKDYKKIICIDNKLNSKRTLNLIPFVKNINKKNIKSGKKFVILDHDLIKYNEYNFKNKNEIIVLNGGSGLPNEKVINFLKKFKKKPTYIFGPLIKIKDIKKIKHINKLKIKVDPENYFSLIKSSKNVICKFGVSVFECISLGIKPHVLIYDETLERLKDINLLKKLGYIFIFNDKTSLTNSKKRFNFKKLTFGAKFINQYL